MKRFFAILVAALAISSVSAQKWVDATELGIHGHTQKTDKSPYYRFDHTPYEGFSKAIIRYAKASSGLYIVFKTNSSKISARWENVPKRIGDNMTGISQLGLDLYIKDNGKWRFAAVGRVSILPEKNERTKTLINNLAEGEKECLLYLPGWCELTKLEIGVDKDATIEGLPKPFRHKVIVHGSSITHGASASRPAMNYPALMSRNLGIDFVNFGFSGQCKMQPQFLEFLKSCEADAFVFDAFSNPTEKQIKERLNNFVEELVKAHPGKPLIFIQSPIDLDSNFDTKKYAARLSLIATSAKMMKALAKKHKDVYFLDVPNVLGTDATIDNSHPTDLGFDRFLKAYQPKIAKILKKYGIK
jgi:hypothetical protein